MKPFLLLSTRPEDAAAAGERAAVVQFSGLDDDDVHQIRVEAAPLHPVNLDEYSGVILGGGPFNSSDHAKSELQVRVEADLACVISDVLSQDFPFLGLCYGVGTITTHLGGLVDRTHGEPVGAVDIALTKAGRDDPLLSGVPDHFRAFVGHKEAVSRLPSGAVLLATGSACPVQMYRVLDNCYVTQFHPELDAPGIGARIDIYRDAGYFRPDETEALIAATAAEQITPQVHGIMATFAQRYATG